MTADGTDEPQTTAKRRRFTWRHALGVGVAIAVVVATFVFILPKIADYRDVWGVVKGLSWKDIALLVGATILNLVTFAPPWMAALPGLRFRQAFVVTQASTASTYVAPGGVAVGMALSFAMLRAWGFVSAAVGLAVALTGVWNQLSMLAFPTLALVLLTFTGDAHTALDTVAFLGLAIFLVVVAAFAAALSTPRLARRIGDLAARIVSWAKRLIRRKPVGWDGESFVRFRDRTNALLKRRWHVLTLATLAGHFTVFLVLLTSLRVLDVSGERGERGGGLRRLVARPPARLDPDHAGRARRRGARSHDCPRGLRRRPGGGGRRRSRLPLPDDRAHARDRASRRRDVEALPARGAPDGEPPAASAPPPGASL